MSLSDPSNMLLARSIQGYMTTDLDFPCVIRMFVCRDFNRESVWRS